MRGTVGYHGLICSWRKYQDIANIYVCFPYRTGREQLEQTRRVLQDIQRGSYPAVIRNHIAMIKRKATSQWGIPATFTLGVKYTEASTPEIRAAKLVAPYPPGTFWIKHGIVGIGFCVHEFWNSNYNNSRYFLSHWERGRTGASFSDHGRWAGQPHWMACFSCWPRQGLLPEYVVPELLQLDDL